MNFKNLPQALESWERLGISFRLILMRQKHDICRVDLIWCMSCGLRILLELIKVSDSIRVFFHSDRCHTEPGVVEN